MLNATLTVNQAVWLAAAMMTNELFKNNEVKSRADIALVQGDIQKRAQSLPAKIVTTLK